MFRKIILFGLGLVVLAACNTKFNVNGEYEEKAIVHFLLDQGQEFHFLKLNKTFLQEGDAFDFAKEADLSYFDNVVAVVEEIKNGSKTREWTLQDTTINNKKEGAFYGPDQKLYFFKADDLDETALYRLKIDVDNGNHIITGQTRLVEGVSIKSPNQNQSFKFAPNSVATAGYLNTAITFNAGKGATFKMQLRFEYEEFTASGSVVKPLVWELGSIDRVDMGAATGSFVAKGNTFYEIVNKTVKANPDVTKRNLTLGDIVLTAGSEDLHTYILSNAPTSSLAQSKPSFTNLEGALGIFSSRVTVVQTKPNFDNPNSRVVDQNSMKELCTGTYTAALKFCSQYPEDSGRPYSCD